MRFMYVCCFMLGVVCAKPSCDKSPSMKGEAADMDMLEALTPSNCTINTEVTSANDEVETATPSYGHLAKSLNEVQNLGLEEYFMNFARTEMSAFLDIIPTTFPLWTSHPCKECIHRYLKCKEFCLQLLVESTDHVLDSFACIVTCWQKVTTCCIARRRTEAHPDSISAIKE